MSWEDEFVIVKNETEDDLEWRAKIYRAGSQATVPFLIMANEYGDPRSTPGGHQVYLASNGDRGVIQPRESERNRVQSSWSIGIQGRDWGVIPPLTFYNMDGERLYTVVDDPQGEHVAPANPTVEQQAMLQKTVERQQQIINRLLEVSGLDRDALPTEPSDSVLAAPPDIPTDDSTASDTQSPFAHSGDDVPTIEE